MQARGNEYHILQKIPVTNSRKLPALQRQMANVLAQSGRLYINADNRRNFVHFTTASGTVSLSTRELNDPAKRTQVKQIIQNSIPLGLGPVAVNQRLEQLQAELKRGRGVDAETEAKVACLLVQAAAPEVIATLIYENTQVFVSFSHTVGDLLAVHFWQETGSAGGLQATDDSGARVYVSCGGDPFFDGKEEEKYYQTDGFDALARFMVIAGQELGHFADIRRSKNGRMQGRHSADMAGRLAPSITCKTARDGDMRQVQALQQAFVQTGGQALWKVENAVAFFDAKRKYSLGWAWRQWRRFWAYQRFHARRARAGLPAYSRTEPKLRYAHFYARMLNDMAFNLAPDADAYRRADKLEEEAIACIEALARVPQQVHKWGHAATKTCWPGLYALYYGQVLPSLFSYLPENYREKLKHRP